jgi:hypothetical protein
MISQGPKIYKLFLSYFNQSPDVSSVKIKYTLTKGKKDWLERHNKFYINALFDFINPQDKTLVECKTQETRQVMAGCTTLHLIPIFYIHGKTSFKDFTIEVIKTNDDDKKIIEVTISHHLGHQYIYDFLQNIYLNYCKKYYNTIDSNCYFYNKIGSSYEKLTLKNHTSFNDIFFPEKNLIINLLNKSIFITKKRGSYLHFLSNRFNRFHSSCSYMY